MYYTTSNNDEVDAFHFGCLGVNVELELNH